jgi:DHA1 family bicyclomycin/chloramphenicol resistance-like MFS transporter
VAGLMNVDPRAAGFASSFYGFSQMAFGAVFTLAVGLWHADSAIPTAVTLIGASFIAMVSLSRV